MSLMPSSKVWIARPEDREIRSQRETIVSQVLGSPTEIYLEDLSVHPSSSGQQTLSVYLTFRALDYSGKDLNPNSRTVLTLRVQTEPRELPLLSGMIGRSFWFQREESTDWLDLQVLKKHYEALLESYEYLSETIKDLAKQLP